MVDEMQTVPRIPRSRQPALIFPNPKPLVALLTKRQYVTSSLDCLLLLKICAVNLLPQTAASITLKKGMKTSVPCFPL